MRKSDVDLLSCSKRKILRHVYRGVQEDGMRRRCYNFELSILYKEPNIVRSIKINRSRWLGYLERMDDMEPPKRTRKRGRPRARFRDQVEEDLRMLGVRDYRDKAGDREEW